jgi:DNA protecting protein DprA
LTADGQRQLAGQTGAIPEDVALLALHALGGVGYWTLRKLAENRRSLSSILDLDAEDLRRALSLAGARLRRRIETDAWRDRMVEEGLRRKATLLSRGIRLLTSEDSSFPESLRAIPQAPYWLFVEGAVGILTEPSLAVVGTREPSADGLFLARFVGACLSELRVPTISGLAQGIDETIHEASIRYGVPTVAVLGTGILEHFPRSSATLRRAIVEHGGALVSEYLPSDSYSKENFVRRNRIQAALSRLVLPVEWQIKSGTAHTVRYAHDFGKPLVALRLPDWRDRPELQFVQSIGGSVFSIPGQEREFRDHVTHAIHSAPAQVGQLALWIDPERPRRSRQP